MIKPNKVDWTFTEHQCHAKGILEGMVLGFGLCSSIITTGFLYYLIMKG